MGKKHPYYGKSMSINFPDFPHTMGFAVFSRTVGNLWRNPCISRMLKYTIGWESDGKKAPILWEKYDYQFPRLSPYDGFCCIFPYCGKLIGKPMHFPYDGIGVNFFLCYLVDPNMILMAVYSCKLLILYFFPLNHNFTEPVFSHTSSASGMVNKMNHIPTSSSTGKCH